MATIEKIVNNELGYAFNLQNELSDYINFLRKAKNVLGSYAIVDLTSDQKLELKNKYIAKKANVKQAAIDM